MDNLKRTERVASELRLQRIAASDGDDVLALYLTLWYTWVALSSHLPGIILNNARSSSPLPSPHEDASLQQGMDSFNDCARVDGNILPLNNVVVHDSTSTEKATPTIYSLQKVRRDRLYRNLTREKAKTEVSKTASNRILPCPHLQCLHNQDRKLTRSGFIDHM